jgi:hypothetical protein
MTEPHELHWKASKHIMHYIQGTHRYEIHYASGHKFIFDWIYMDSDWVGDLDDHKSTSGYNFHLGLVPFVGRARSNMPLLFLRLRLSIEGLLMPPLRLFGFRISSLNLASLFRSHQSSTVTTRAPSRSRRTWFIISGPNTSRSTCIFLGS